MQKTKVKKTNHNRFSKTENSDRKLKNKSLKPKNVIFGLAPVLEALKANSRKIEKILIAEGTRGHRVTEIIDLAKEKRISWQKVSRDSIEKLAAPGAKHQGVLAFTSSADYEDAETLLGKIFAQENALILILDGIEDPRNLGAILRTSECAGVNGVFIPEHRAVGLTETVVKTSAGATEHISIAKVKNLNRLIEELKKNNFWIVGASNQAKMNYTDWDWTLKTALVLGNEGKGLHRLVAENCDALVKIPMQGNIESLNVSVACGVLLFEAIRQRKNN
jgi:23S rRNA (guanosine2251-2'-O)-methyltransferase